MHSTFSKMSTRVARGYQLRSCCCRRADGVDVSRHWPHFGRNRRRWMTLLTLITCQGYRLLTPVSLNDGPDTLAKPVIKPMLLPPWPREKLRASATPNACCQQVVFLGPFASAPCQHEALALDAVSLRATPQLDPRPLLQPQPKQLLWTWRRLLTFATTANPGHTRQTAVPHTTGERCFRSSNSA